MWRAFAEGSTTVLAQRYRVRDTLIEGLPVTVVAKAVNHGPLPTAGAAVQIHLGTSLADGVKVEVGGGTCRVASLSNDYIECTLSDLSAEERQIKAAGSTGLAAGDQLTGDATIRAVDDRPADHGYANDYASLSVPVGA